MTAHILGGAPIGATAETGVIDAYHRVFGHPGLHVVDGAAVTANLGVNPSLTITAQAERAVSMWPNRGEPDPRPPLGEPYVRVDPVRPGTARGAGGRARRPPQTGAGLSPRSTRAALPAGAVSRPARMQRPGPLVRAAGGLERGGGGEEAFVVVVEQRGGTVERARWRRGSRRRSGRAATRCLAASGGRPARRLRRAGRRASAAGSR